jgi:hypothetical protein
MPLLSLHLYRFVKAILIWLQHVKFKSFFSLGTDIAKLILLRARQVVSKEKKITASTHP